MGGNVFKNKTFIQRISQGPYSDLVLFYDDVLELQFEYVADCDLQNKTPNIIDFIRYLNGREQTTN